MHEPSGAVRIRLRARHHDARLCGASSRLTNVTSRERRSGSVGAQPAEADVGCAPQKLYSALKPARFACVRHVERRVRDGLPRRTRFRSPKSDVSSSLYSADRLTHPQRPSDHLGRFQHVHLAGALRVVARSRNACNSRRCGSAVCAPSAVVASAAAQLAKRAASGRSWPSESATARPAVNASPAPVASTRSTSTSGTHSSPDCRRRRFPPGRFDDCCAGALREQRPSSLAC